MFVYTDMDITLSYERIFQSYLRKRKEKMKTKYTVISAIVVVITALVSFHIGWIEHKVVYIPVEKNLVLDYKLYSEKTDTYHNYNMKSPCTVEIEGGTMGDLQSELLEKLPDLCTMRNVKIVLTEDGNYLQFWMKSMSISGTEQLHKNADKIYALLTKDNLIAEYSFLGWDSPDSVSFSKDISLKEAYSKAYGDVVPNNPVWCVKSIWFKLS